METESSTQPRSTNPFTGEVVFTTKFMTEDEITKRIQDSWNAFMTFRRTDLNTRSTRLNTLADVIDKNMDKISRTITSETGKTIMQSRKEVRKSVKLIRYYIQHSSEFLKPEEIKVEGARRSYVMYEPLGPIFHITSFSYPFFQDIRRSVPSLLMGNTVLSRSSTMTPQTAMLVEDIFRQAGFTSGEYLNLTTSVDQYEMIIRNPIIRGVSYIGNMRDSQTIGSIVGKYSKRYVSTLSSPHFHIVMKDADLEWTLSKSFMNKSKPTSGQTWTSPKTFIIEDSVYDNFRTMLVERLKTVSFGDPMDEKTMVGPLTCKTELQRTMDILKRSQEQGGKVIYGGSQPTGTNLKGGLFFTPTIVEVQPGNVLLNEEFSAPIFPIMRYRTEEDIFKITNMSMFGCATAIFTRDESRVERMIPMLDTSCVFVNSRVKYHPELPMRAIKWSGVGFSGGRWGAWEFSNVKSVLISPTTTTMAK